MSYLVKVEIEDVATRAKATLVMQELQEQQLLELRLDIGEMFRQGAIFIQSTVAPAGEEK